MAATGAIAALKQRKKRKETGKEKLADFALHQNVNSANTGGSSQSAYRLSLPSFLCHTINLSDEFPTGPGIGEYFIFLHSKVPNL